MKLSALAEAISSSVSSTRSGALVCERVGSQGDPDVVRVEHDSRQVQQGDLFVCIPGVKVDGHSFATEAVARGAVALLCAREISVDVAQLRCDDPRRAMAHVAAALAGYPSRTLSVVGVTGTNGKTTVVSLLADVLRSLGDDVEVIGTLTGSRTTPESNELHVMMREMLQAGKQRVLMEVSSHALDMGRVDGTEFEVVVFTNLSVDHLDYHGNMEAYFAAKSVLFDQRFAPTAVIDVTSPHGRLLADTSNQQVIRVAPNPAVAASAGSLRLRWRDRDIDVPVGGLFNVANLTLVAETAVALGFEVAEVAAALADVHPVPGRFEAIDVGQAFSVVVDYAHTPDGLESVLTSVGELAEHGRIIVVFGCGGDRDTSKRPAMGSVAERFADVVIVTSDNPRSESPVAITDAIIAGMTRAPWLVDNDRRLAIRAAFEQALPGDFVVIAGKGHEQTQVTGDTVTEFDDRVVAREVLLAMRNAEVPSE